MNRFFSGKNVRYLEKGKRDYWVSFQRGRDLLGGKSDSIGLALLIVFQMTGLYSSVMDGSSVVGKRILCK